MYMIILAVSKVAGGKKACLLGTPAPMCDQASWARQLHFYPRREPLARGSDDYPRYVAGQMRLLPAETAPMLDMHQQRSLRTTKTPPPTIEYAHQLTDSRASLWDTGSRSLAFPGATEDCWAVGGVKTLARSQSSVLAPRALARARASDQFRTTSMEYGGHWEAATAAPSPNTRSLRVLRYPPMHQAPLLAGGYSW